MTEKDHEALFTDPVMRIRRKIPSPVRVAHEVKGAAYALLMLKEAALDALLGQHCPQCRVPTRVYPRDLYNHNMKRHRR